MWRKCLGKRAKMVGKIYFLLGKISQNGRENDEENGGVIFVDERKSVQLVHSFWSLAPRVRTFASSS